MEVVLVPGHGRAAVATQPYSPGAIVLDEAPLLVWETSRECTGLLCYR